MLAKFDYLGFMAQFNRHITDIQELHTRVKYYAATHEFIQQHNASNKSSVAGHNQFSDWSPAEYKHMLGYVAEESHVRNEVWLDASNTSPIDWRSEGGVTGVKDQGQCGSCWAFATIAGFETAQFVANGTLLSFAEQQIVDCSGNAYFNFGCNGGMAERAYNYMAASDGTALEADYPYTSGTTGTKSSSGCLGDGQPITSHKATSSVEVTKNDPDQLKAALAIGAVTVGIEADTMYFQTYQSGILDDASACGTTLDHAVTAVGWGVDDSNTEYWIIKNSWSSTWGEDGYVRMAIVDGIGICGVQ